MCIRDSANGGVLPNINAFFLHKKTNDINIIQELEINFLSEEINFLSE